jgi:hypothetical protein
LSKAGKPGSDKARKPASPNNRKSNVLKPSRLSSLLANITLIYFRGSTGLTGLTGQPKNGYTWFADLFTSERISTPVYKYSRNEIC